MSDKELKNFINNTVYEYSNVVYTSLCEVIKQILNKEPNINTSDIWNENIKWANNRHANGDN